MINFCFVSLFGYSFTECKRGMSSLTQIFFFFKRLFFVFDKKIGFFWLDFYLSAVLIFQHVEVELNLIKTSSGEIRIVIDLLIRWWIEWHNFDWYGMLGIEIRNGKSLWNKGASHPAIDMISNYGLTLSTGPADMSDGVQSDKNPVILGLGLDPIKIRPNVRQTLYAMLRLRVLRLFRSLQLLYFTVLAPLALVALGLYLNSIQTNEVKMQSLSLQNGNSLFKFYFSTLRK